MIGIVGSGQIKAFAYLIENADSKNHIQGTQEEIATESGVSTRTVSSLLGKLKKSGYIKEKRSGMHILDPRVMHYGSIGNKMVILKAWTGLEEETKQSE